MGGLTKPSERFCSEIKPAFEDYRSAPFNERLANNLAAAIDHHLDWTYEFYYRGGSGSRLLGADDLPSFRREIFRQCPQLQMMHDLSDARHHRFLTRPSNPPRVVATSTAAYVIEESELRVRGYDMAFLPTATAALSFWQAWPD